VTSRIAPIQVVRRIKRRNAEQLREATRSGRLQVLLESRPVEIRPASVTVDVSGARRELRNDFVFVFAGGTSPNKFLERVGVRVGPRDLTEEAGREGRLSAASA
jgi:thioredoxin reductase